MTSAISIPITQKIETRLDRWLADQLPETSRARLQALMCEGSVTANGHVLTARSHPTVGTVIRIEFPPPVTVSLMPEAIALHVLYEDSELIVVNKQPGLVVHPAPGHPQGTLVNALMHRCPDLAGIGGEIRPGIVHRLDRDTSGALVVAKTQRAMSGLVDLFKAGDVTKAYICFVWGCPEPRSGLIDTLIARSSSDRKRMTTKTSRGRRSLTRYRVVQFFKSAGISLVRVNIETGRTHQIRVHMKHIQTPVVGDPVYGRRTPPLLPAGYAPQRQMLHAERLAFTHPVSGIFVDCRAPWPQDMLEFALFLGFDGSTSGCLRFLDEVLPEQDDEK